MPYEKYLSSVNGIIGLFFPPLSSPLKEHKLFLWFEEVLFKKKKTNRNLNMVIDHLHLLGLPLETKSKRSKGILKIYKIDINDK